MRALAVISSVLCAAAAAAQPCETVTTIGPVTVKRTQGALVYSGGLAIDADGAPNAYGPDGKGLDHLANARQAGELVGPRDEER